MCMTVFTPPYAAFGGFSYASDWSYRFRKINDQRIPFFAIHSGTPGQSHSAMGVQATWAGSSQPLRRSWRHRNSGGSVDPPSFPASAKPPTRPTSTQQVSQGTSRKRRSWSWKGGDSVIMWRLRWVLENLCIFVLCLLWLSARICAGEKNSRVRKNAMGFCATQESWQTSEDWLSVKMYALCLLFYFGFCLSGLTATSVIREKVGEGLHYFFNAFGRTVNEGGNSYTAWPRTLR